MEEEEIHPPRKSYAEVVGRKAALPSREKSFEDIVTSMKSENVGVREASVYKNEPYIPVSKKKCRSLPNGSNMAFVGNLDGKHILLNFDREEDYCRLFAKPVWCINVVPMRILKYTFDFDSQKESPIVPVWIALPKLPLVFYYKAILFSIASVIGTPSEVG
ncbi:Uncharacterized protein Adt_24073 [Abeliophyllum distichum]|uniref:DUF4283 domain-containing protein n=1 Tax=Abeliophyllum distichum TaxID=126358 RepID=A0ABD1SDQ2_9LAMI